MANQRRLVAGTRRDGTAAGGQFTNKTVPAVKTGDVGFDDYEPSTEPVQCAVRSLGARTVFERTVETDAAGNKVVSVTTNTEDPTMLLLARRGDTDYWTGDNWRKHRKDRRVWTADIAARMLEEGLVSTATNDSTVNAIRTVMVTANQKKKTDWRFKPDPHVLTGIVAQTRTLRLLQSMTNGAKGWYTTFAGQTIPDHVDLVWKRQFDTLLAAYRRLPQPPWEDTNQPWESQTVAGHATTTNGENIFVGEHGDLLWRALTETDTHGMSPLKAGVYGATSQHHSEMVAAAMLYNDDAAKQLTTEALFVGFDGFRWDIVSRVQFKLKQALNPKTGECRFTNEQQTRIRGFIDKLDALN